MTAGGALTTVTRGHMAFRAALSALAHPGRWFPLPCSTVDDAVAALEQAVWDRPDGVVIAQGTSSNGLLLTVDRGSEEFPEDGATVLYRPGPGETTNVVLQGPGVNGALRTTLPLSPAELEDRAVACARWPLGVDLLFVDERSCVAALPRTTRVEMRA